MHKTCASFDFQPHCCNGRISSVRLRSAVRHSRCHRLQAIRHPKSPGLVQSIFGTLGCSNTVKPFWMKRSVGLDDKPVPRAAEFGPPVPPTLKLAPAPYRKSFLIGWPWRLKIQAALTVVTRWFSLCTMLRCKNHPLYCLLLTLAAQMSINLSEKLA